MLVSTTTATALRCPECGKIEYNGISLFQFSGYASVVLICGCGTTLATLFSSNYRKFMLEIYCGMCTGSHKYFFAGKEIWSQGAAEILCCEDTGLESGFIGNREAVNGAIKQLEYSATRLDFGLNDECINDSDLINQLSNSLSEKIEAGKLSCKCGNTKLQVETLQDSVELNCQHCKSCTQVAIESEEYLMVLEHNNEIQLTPNGLVIANMVSANSKRGQDNKL